MLEQFFKALKTLFGFNNERCEPTKRKLRDHSDDYECDISTDDEEFEYDTPNKRRRIGQNLDIMSDWNKPRKNFGDLYYFSKPGEAFPRKRYDYSQISGIIPKSKHSENFATASLTSKFVDSRKTSERQFESSFKHEKSIFRPTPKSFSIKSSTAMPINRRPLVDPDCMIINGNSRHDEEKFREKIAPRKTLQNSTSSLAVERVNGANSLKKSQAICDHVCQIHSRPPISNNTRKKLTVNQCIQLEEREKYRQLLSRYTSSPTNLTPVVPTLDSPTHSENSSTHISNLKNSVTKQRLNYLEYKQQREKILQSSKKLPQLEQRTKSLSDRSLSNSVVSVTSNVSSSTSDDAVITKVEPPKWKKMSSDFVENPYNSKWLDNWRRQLTADRQEKSRLIEEAEKKVRKPPWSKTLDDLQENIREQLTIAEKEAEIIEEIFLIKDTKEEVEEEDVEPMPELTPEMEELIEEALRPHPPDEVISNGFRLQIRRRDMETLQDLNWLNDEVINFYMNLIMERGKLSNMPSVYACNTFFYPKLVSGGHAALSRWTRKIDIFSNDIMLVPVHLGVHWCLAVVDFRKKGIKYYDSMGGKNNECLNALCNYLQAESLEKKRKTLDVTNWSLENVTDAPQQMNSSDCGMFACKYAEYITRNAKITFKQNHMPYFRRRMVYEILKTRLL